MVKKFLSSAFLFLILSFLLFAPVFPNTFIKYNQNNNVLSATSKNYGQLVKINDINKLSKVVTIKAFASQRAYYDNIFELTNYTDSSQLYTIENFVNDKSVVVTVKFSNNLNEILLHPNEKTSVSLEVLGSEKDAEAKIFLEILPKIIQNKNYR